MKNIHGLNLTQNLTQNLTLKVREIKLGDGEFGKDYYMG